MKFLRQLKLRVRPSSLYAVICLATSSICIGGPTRAETIVFIRHGEKPNDGLGQLSCQGLNRALKLPDVLSRMFGNPTAAFAPNPSVQKEDGGKPFDYVRPLATIEPTAIRFDLPVNTNIGYDDVNTLNATLSQPKYSDGVIVVVWEHKQIMDAVTGILTAHHSDPNVVPKWHGSDFDSIYVVRVSADGDATFERREEQLDDQPATCPK